MTETELRDLFWADEDLQQILKVSRDLQLADTWICAGILRNFVWNVLSGRPGFDGTTDVDVVFYDPKISYAATLTLEQQLLTTAPKYRWQLKNEVYMHQHTPGSRPYTDTRDAIAKFPETATAIGLRLINGTPELFLPYGSADLCALAVRPTPYFKHDAQRMASYQRRVQTKPWQQKWPQLQMFLA